MLTLVDDPHFSWPCLSVIFQRQSCFYQAMGGDFPKTDKNKIVMLQETYEWLKITVSSISTSSSFFFYINSDAFIQIFLDLSFMMKYLVLYININTLQIIIEELKLPILLFVITQKYCCCCCSCLQLMALFTAIFIKKRSLLFLKILFSQSKLMSHFVPVFTFFKLIERCLWWS